LATFTYRTISIQQPIHLINQLNIFDNYIGPLGHVYKQRFVTKTRLNIGKQAFSVAAPAIWTQLPITIKSSETIATIRKQNQDIFV